MAILDIRGTHGSGKSFIVHSLIKRYGVDEIRDYEDEDARIRGRLLGYRLKGPDVAIVGKYENICGGCDQVSSADEIVRRVKLMAEQHYHVILEGILVSHTFKRYSELAREMGDYRFLFLDTPLQTCIDRVKARRRGRGKDGPFDPKNVIKDWHGVWERVRTKCIHAGHMVIELDHRHPMDYILQVIHETR
jgi:predicted ABC-type ATPase